jgi:DNA polymerase V
MELSFFGSAQDRPPLTAQQQGMMGFPSPAQDYLEPPLDLHTHLVGNPLATFFVRVGAGAGGGGLAEGDLLVVDRSRPPADGEVAVCAHQGSFVLQRLAVHRGKITMYSLQGQAPGQPVDDEHWVWGVVVHLIRTLA